MDNEEEVQGVKFSQFPSEIPDSGDVVVGLRSGDNARFSISNIVLAVRQGLSNLFVPLTRKINNKALSSDIILNASDVGARASNWTPSASDVGAIPTTDKGAANGVASLGNDGKVPSAQLDLSSKQDSITASGILKGDGAGGVSAATAGTDYQTPLTAGTDYATPGMIPTVPSAYTSNPEMDGTASPGSSNNYARGDHVHPTDSTKAAKSDLTSIQATGTTNTTGAAIPAGAYLYLNGVLYRAKVQIDQNATFTVNTNCEQALVNRGLIKQYPFTGTTSSNYGGISGILPSGLGDIVSIKITKVNASSGLNTYAIPYVGTDGNLSGALFYNLVTGSLKSVAIEGVALYV